MVRLVYFDLYLEHLLFRELICAQFYPFPDFRLFPIQSDWSILTCILNTCYFASCFVPNFTPFRIFDYFPCSSRLRKWRRCPMVQYSSPSRHFSQCPKVLTCFILGFPHPESRFSLKIHAGIRTRRWDERPGERRAIEHQTPPHVTARAFVCDSHFTAAGEKLCLGDRRSRELGVGWRC